MINGKKVIGIICECNPFHNGHKRLIDNAKKHGDIIIAVMSGNFVQRGEPAIYDKYKRTKSLLKNGVSLVIELPLEASLSSAEYFALSSISVLNKLKIVDNIIFGSKINNIEKLSEIADTKSIEVKSYMKKGMSYPLAMEKCLNNKLSPNDILAIEYIKALKKTKSKIKPLCIKRRSDLPTASELRKKIQKKITVNSFSDILSYKIMNASNLKNIYTVNNDLLNAIYNTRHLNLSFEKRAKLLNTKNRTLASIKRAFFNIIFDIKDNEVNLKKVSYIRILGIKKEAMPLIKHIKVPYLMSYANSSYKDFANKFNKSILNSKSINNAIKASDMYYLLSGDKNPEATKALVLA